PMSSPPSTTAWGSRTKWSCATGCSGRSSSCPGGARSGSCEVKELSEKGLRKSVFSEKTDFSNRQRRQGYLHTRELLGQEERSAWADRGGPRAALCSSGQGFAKPPVDPKPQGNATQAPKADADPDEVSSFLIAAIVTVANARQLRQGHGGRP